MAALRPAHLTRHGSARGGTHRGTHRGTHCGVRPLAGRRWSLKPVCLAVLGVAAWLGTPVAWALPEGAVPTLGQAQVQAGGNGRLQILQTSAQAGFDWRSFNIAAGERVQVLQPSAQSILFNRVTGSDPSLILGQLQANGRVFLSNPRGIIFGTGAQVDVGGLLATTLTINHTAGAGGRWQLGGGDAATGLLRMDGSIRAPGGTVALVGPQLSVGGHILAGRLGLAAAGAAQVDVDGDGLIFFNLRDENLAARLQLLPAASLLARSAELRAAARGQFADTVLNLEGVVRAQGLVQQGGQVVIGGAAPQILVDGGASGVTRVAGTLDASATAAGEHGGQVRVLGARVWLDASARLDARGDAGGGLLHVGGGWQGQGIGRNALHTRVAAGAQLDASAIRLGDGGQVVVWADDSTVFNGTIRARGGLLGGDGGAVETSGKLQLGIGSGTVDAGAAAGFQVGRWLLDPQDILVSNADDASATQATTIGWSLVPAAGIFKIKPAALRQDNTAVLLQATRDVTIDAPVVLNTGQSFTAEAGRDVIVSSGGTVTTVNQPISLVASKDMDGPPVAGPPVAGNLHSADSAGRVSMLGTLDAGTGAISIRHSSNSTGLHQLGGRASGNSLAVTGPVTLAPTVTLDVGSLTLDSAVTLTQNSTISVPGSRSITIAQAIGDGAAPAAARSLTKLGTGTLTLSGTNTYRGGTVVAGGTLRLGSANAVASGTVTLGTVGANAPVLAVDVDSSLAALVGGAAAADGAAAVGEVQIADGKTLTTGAVDSSYSGKISGAAGTLAKAGVGNFTLAGATGFAGATRLDAGTLTLGHADALAGSVVTLGTEAANAPLLVVATDSRIAALAGGAAAAGEVQIADGKTLTTGAVDSSYSGKISGAAGTLAKTGVRIFTLAGATGFTGATRLDAGTLTLSHADALAGSVVTLGTEAANAPVLVVATDSRIAALAGGAAAAGEVQIADGKTLTTGAVDSSYSGKISGAAGTLAKTGVRIFTLAGATGFTGATRLDAGTLTLGHADALAGSVVTLGTEATNAPVLVVATDSRIAALAGGAAAAGEVRIADGKTLTTGAVDSSYSGKISGAVGTLAKTGVRIFTLAGATGFTGATRLDAGTLTLGHANALAGSVVTLGTEAADAPVLVVAADSTVTALAGGAAAAGVVAAVGTVQIADGKTLTTGAASSSYSGLISRVGSSGTLAKAGAGNFTLSGATGFTGATWLNGGTLTLGHADSLADSVVTLGVVAAHAPLLAVAASSRIAALAGGAAAAGGVAAVGEVQIADGKTLTTGAVDSSYNGAIAGLGSLVKQGSGSFTLAGSNTYSGGTVVGGGRLQVAADGNLGAASAAITLQDGATLAWTADGTLAAGRSLVMGAGGGALEVAAAHTLVFKSRLQGSGPLAKTGAGTLELAADNASEAATLALDAGTLRLNSADALAGRTVTLGTAAAAVLDVAVDSNIAALAGGAAAVSEVRIADGKTLTTGSADSSYSGLLTRVGASATLAKAGAGNFTLAAATGFSRCHAPGRRHADPGPCRRAAWQCGDAGHGDRRCAGGGDRQQHRRAGGRCGGCVRGADRRWQDLDHRCRLQQLQRAAHTGRWQRHAGQGGRWSISRWPLRQASPVPRAWTVAR